MSAVQTSIDGITAVSMPALIALRARARTLEHTPMRTRDARAGQQASAVRGRGMDYAESRVYQPGDDARNIDWRRTARSGKLHTKLFEEDRERALVVMLDTHAGMHFGTRVRYKSVAAARAAAIVVWAAVRAGERVGALAWGPVRAQVPPQAGTRGASRVLAALVRWSAPRGTRDQAGDTGGSLSLACRRAGRLVAPGSRVLLVSDGWCTDAEAARALAGLARRRDVGILIVADALEHTAPPGGAYAFETGAGRVALDLHAASARAAFAAALDAGVRGLTDAAKRAGVRCEVLDAASPPDALLARLWHPTGRQR
ncbi:MAG TPA: DUF58 domain-containing protein [Rhodanobacteraceae bacterium]|nr:DUF58 domain-containing protein [Rhodanobacteraceae bacterium]